MPYTYQYQRPAVTVDNLIIKKTEAGEQILLIERGIEPFKGMWALPGGFVNMDEKLEQAALRELKEETGLTNISLKQFRTYGDPGRDPRHRTISVVFYSIIEHDKKSTPVAGDDAAQAKWFDITNLPALAFDHEQIIHEAVEALYFT